MRASLPPERCWRPPKNMSKMLPNPPPVAAEDVPDVPGVGEVVPVERTVLELGIDASVAILIVELSLFLIDQHLVRLGHFLEALLGDLAVLLGDVGVVLHCQFAIRLLDVLDARILGNA